MDLSKTLHSHLTETANTQRASPSPKGEKNKSLQVHHLEDLAEVPELDQLLKQVRNHQLAILSDGQGGLWPAARSRWMRHHWPDVMRSWLKAYPRIFEMAEQGELPSPSHRQKLPIEQSDNLEETDHPKGTTRPRRVTRRMLRAWRLSRPWLLARLPELEALGWTRSKLFRAGRLPYPLGPWGTAFCSNWLIPDVEVKIDSEGAIRWTWTEATGRTVTQAKRPHP